MTTGLKQATPEAYKLLHDGAKLFSIVEENGLRIDVPYLDRTIKEVKAEIISLEDSLREGEEWKAWARCYGNKMSLESPTQLGRVIFGALGYKRNPYLKEKRKGEKYGELAEPNNIAAFEHLTRRVPFVRDYFEVRRLKKALSTYLLGIKRETVNGFVHPFQDLHTAESYRSSSSRPNFHNMPTRNKLIAKIVRECVVPRPGNVFLGKDYSGAEVKVAYCYNKDPVFREDVLNGDMHYDRALELYLLSPEEMAGMKKLIRYVVKNRFVFAQFYGSFYGLCAPDLWDAISLYDLKTTGGVSLYEHLKSKGVTRLGRCDPDEEPERGTFEYLVKQVEHRMWRERYVVYDRWKKDWWNQYLALGGFHTLTGFTLEGPFRRNQVLCDPVQGSSFHCLLWSAVEIQRRIRRYKLKARIVDQVHDSLLFDLPPGEVNTVREMAEEVATGEVARHWDWITIPLAVEFELGRDNWFAMEPYDGSTLS